MTTRDIKFRAWDRSKSVMIDYIPAILFEYKNPSISLTSRDSIHNSKEWDVLYSDDFYLMQYTGLKDKNGTDIYEGDIVTCVSKSEIKWKSKGVVQYLETSAGFAINLGEEPASNTENDHFTFFWATENFEVIGNIYENPEIL